MLDLEVRPGKGVQGGGGGCSPQLSITASGRLTADHIARQLIKHTSLKNASHHLQPHGAQTRETPLQSRASVRHRGPASHQRFSPLWSAHCYISRPGPDSGPSPASKMLTLSLPVLPRPDFWICAFVITLIYLHHARVLLLPNNDKCSRD